MRTPYISTPDKEYDFGWFISEYRGYTEIEHAGSVRGFAARVSLIPSQGIRIILLTNLPF